MREELLKKINNSLSMADDYSTEIEKANGYSTYILPVYIGKDLPFFEEVKEDFYSIIKDKGLNIIYEKDYLLFISQNVKKENPNLLYFPVRDLIDSIENQDQDLLEFERVVISIQDLIVEELFARVNKLNLKNKNHLKLL